MQKTTEHFDVIIGGGGLAGMAATKAFAALGMRCVCIDPSGGARAPAADTRSTAFLQPSRAFLERIGLWQHLSAQASPLQTMRIIDAGGTEMAARLNCEFDARDISADPFGWNLPNAVLQRVFHDVLDQDPQIHHITDVAITDVLTRSGRAHVTLSNGARFTAKLLVAADGRHSTIREALGLSVSTLRYGQKAVTFAVTHPKPHGNVSTEIHRSGGPFTLVPLPDLDGQPASAVVWMERGPEALRLATLEESAFESAATARSCHVFGPLKLAAPRNVWPIISQIANSFYAERTALVAEAAHVVPPIGAQGLNMSLADIQCLFDLATADPDGIGSVAQLEAYNRQRRPDALLRVNGVNLLNRASMAEAPILRDLRMQGLKALHSVPPLRNLAMSLGLGTTR